MSSDLQTSLSAFKLIEARSKLHWPVSGLFLFAGAGDGSITPTLGHPNQYWKKKIQAPPLFWFVSSCVLFLVWEASMLVIKRSYSRYSFWVIKAQTRILPVWSYAPSSSSANDPNLIICWKQFNEQTSKIPTFQYFPKRDVYFKKNWVAFPFWNSNFWKLEKDNLWAIMSFIDSINSLTANGLH